MPVPLSLATLGDLPGNVARPTYARGDLSAGIVHFGVGNFHRAHLQVYMDRLMNQGRDLDWPWSAPASPPTTPRCATRSPPRTG